MEKQGKLGQWLRERCQKGNLSTRQAAVKAGGLSPSEPTSLPLRVKRAKRSCAK